MRFFKDTTFLSWTVVVFVLGCILLAANFVGNNPKSVNTGDRTVFYVKAPKHSDARVAVDQLRQLAPYGIAAGVDTPALKSWAQNMSQTAADGREVRQKEGASSNDELLESFQRIETTAATIINGNTAVEQASARTHILLAVDRATWLVKNNSAAENIPALPTDPYGQNDPVTNPDAPTPSPAAPNWETTVEPQPSLNLKQPQPEDLR